MTREELMVQAAKKEIARIASHATLYKGTIDEIEVYEPDDMIDMFKLGAKWADEHPINYDGKAMLHVLNKGAAIGRREMLDKACEWLFEYNKRQAKRFGAKSMMRLPDYTINVGDFRKAMEGEQ